MKNMKKKGFTLVELLVVIAILAILATVSVVGYTAFVNSANESKAITELTQVKTLVKGELMLGDKTETVDTKQVVISLRDDGLTFAYVDDATAVTAEDKTAAVQALVADDIDFEDKLSVDANGNVIYTDDDITAKWEVSSDEVSVP